MPKICYKEISFRPASLALIEQANVIIAEYQKDGFDLTLRQLYYQFVSRDLIPNTQRSYSNLGSVVNDARLAGLIDWEAIVDRTRELRELPHWDSPAAIVADDAKAFRIDLWRDQRFRPEVWIEKDALAGVFLRACQALDVPLFSCRGYTSQSEMWVGAQRMLEHVASEQEPYIFHFGDHDPSGQDMSRDIRDRLALFIGKDVQFERLALNMEQVREYKPPPNPAKITDSRARGYIAEFGRQSWELDALEPRVLAALVRRSVLGIMEKNKWNAAMKEQEKGRAALAKIAAHFEAVESFVDRI